MKVKVEKVLKKIHLKNQNTKKKIKKKLKIIKSLIRKRL